MLTLLFSFAYIYLQNTRYKKTLDENDSLELKVKDELKKNSLKDKEMISHYKYAMEKAEEANASKSQFLANMSHEIRTPLNAILGFIDILKEDSKDVKTISYLEIVSQSSKNLLQIIEDILDFSKIENGKLFIEKINFDAHKEFQIITYLFNAKCLEKNISLSLDIQKSVPSFLLSDPLRIKQVISNLLSNAIKFTPDNKSIEVAFSYINSDLHVSVKDTGVGITNQKLDYIFEAFHQEDNSTTRRYGGTGLGLSIAYELVKLLGGELKVKSQLDLGSEFYFSIPIKKGIEIKQKHNDILNIDFHDKNILLVEDNITNQIYMKLVLKKLNLDFDIASNGEEAVKLFKEKEFDAILMDENMPIMSGLEATKLILEFEKENKLKHTPIIALTANAIKGDRERFLKEGMDEYLTKPLNKNKLVEILGNLMK